MQLIEKYSYVPLERTTARGGARHYKCPITGSQLVSVTTVIDQTADKTGLLEWRKRVGDKEADKVKHEALGLGTLMHTHLECYINGLARPTGTNLVRQQAEAMADQVIEFGLSQVGDVWGSEVGLYYPGLYAGTCDIVGEYRRPSDASIVPAIMDFKTARKMKKREHIENYLDQIAAYAMAHDELHGTNIETGIIFMVDRDFNYQEFILEGAEFQARKMIWLDRLDRYFASV
jgi:genome maintenance exonuclease 1